MRTKVITYCGEKVVLACDGKCEKAWGKHNRPYEVLDYDDIENFEYLSDKELGIAPKDPKTYEGRDGKPTNEKEKLNKWCCRECERSEILSKEEFEEHESFLPDFSKRVFNKRRNR